MTEVKGKAGNRRNATLDLVDDQIKFVIKPGMFRGKGEVHSVPLSEVVSLETKTDVKPFPDAQWTLISHSSGSIEFFSINRNQLRTITKTVAEILEAKALKLKEDEEVFNATRESNVALIVVNLELIDSLMSLISSLNGRVDWAKVEAELKQTESVMSDRLKIPNLNPSSFNSRALRNGVERRLVYVIKQEVHDILSLLYHEASERSEHLLPWFPMDFHRLFLFSALSSWSIELGEITGVDGYEEKDNVEALFEALHRAIVNYTGDSEIHQIDLKEYTPPMIRSNLYRWCDLLLEVPFSPDLE